MTTLLSTLRGEQLKSLYKETAQSWMKQNGYKLDGDKLVKIQVEDSRLQPV